MSLDEILSQCRPDLRPYVVAVQTLQTMRNGPDSRWIAIGDEGVDVWRSAYDSGRVELAHHRVTGGYLLLAIPRRRRTERPEYARLGTFRRLSGIG